MRENPYPGLYVVLAGIECCGKGTQIKLLEQSFKKLGLTKGVDYNFFGEPTPGCFGYKKIRDILGGEMVVDKLYLQEMMAINRNFFEAQLLFDSLQNIPLTIVDRSFYSSFAYYMAEGGEFEYIERLNIDRIIPDCVVFLDIFAEESIKRMKKSKRGTTEIFDGKLKFAQKLRNIYFELFKNTNISGEVKILNGVKPERKIAAKILRTIRRKAEKKNIFLIPKGENKKKKKGRSNNYIGNFLASV